MQLVVVAAAQLVVQLALQLVFCAYFPETAAAALSVCLVWILQLLSSQQRQQRGYLVQNHVWWKKQIIIGKNVVKILMVLVTFDSKFVSRGAINHQNIVLVKLFFLERLVVPMLVDVTAPPAEAKAARLFLAAATDAVRVFLAAAAARRLRARAISKLSPCQHCRLYSLMSADKSFPCGPMFWLVCIATFIRATTVLIFWLWLR